MILSRRASILPKSDIQSWLDSARIFHGELSAAEARVYVELDANEAFSDVQVHGEVRGPFCEYSRTLTTTSPLQELSPGATRLCSAFLPDPCFWTPRLPFTYQIELFAIRDGMTVARREATLGLRPLGVRGSDLFFDGKRIVLRAVDRALSPETPVADWRGTSTSLFTSQVDHNLLRGCATHGVLACIDMDIARGHSPVRLAQTLRQLASHASVGLVILPTNAFTPELLRDRPRNLLLAASVTDVEQAPPEADLLALRATAAETFPAMPDDLRKPVLAVLHCEQKGSLDELRSQCDRLQADLAARGRFAGYLVAETDTVAGASSSGEQPHVP